MPSTFTYYHIELADHALILAENAPTETFIDNVDRMAFDNWEEHRHLFGDEVELTALAHPRAKSVRQVPARIGAALERRAAEVFGQASSPDEALSLGWATEEIDGADEALIAFF